MTATQDGTITGPTSLSLPHMDSRSDVVSHFKLKFYQLYLDQLIELKGHLQLQVIIQLLCIWMGRRFYFLLMLGACCGCPCCHSTGTLGIFLIGHIDSLLWVLLTLLWTHCTRYMGSQEYGICMPCKFTFSQ